MCGMSHVLLVVAVTISGVTLMVMGIAMVAAIMNLVATARFLRGIE